MTGSETTNIKNLKDWPEDASHENGNYFNMCSVCEEQFTGHKRRMICKQCATTQTPEDGNGK